MKTRNLWYARFIIGILLMVAVCKYAYAQFSFTERELSFRNGSVELHGTIMLPDGQDQSPAVVFLHGSGPATRAGFRPYAEKFAKLGIASLFFDKRGSGKSSGSWITSSLDDLAEDALAAVQHLKKEKGIDPGRIGFWGVSQAGWIAPLAASKSQDIAFMILITGGGASPRESELYSYQQQFERTVLSKAEKTEALKVLDAYFHYLATGEGRLKLSTRFDSIRLTRLKSLAEQLERILPSEGNRSNWSWVATYDPVPHIEKLTCPILLMFGDRDTDHPTELAVKRWREGLKNAGNDRITLIVFPGAGHGIRVREGYTGHGRAPFADGYAESQLGWLWNNVIDK